MAIWAGVGKFFSGMPKLAWKGMAAVGSVVPEVAMTPIEAGFGGLHIAKRGYQVHKSMQALNKVSNHSVYREPATPTTVHLYQDPTNPTTVTAVPVSQLVDTIIPAADATEKDRNAQARTLVAEWVHELQQPPQPQPNPRIATLRDDINALLVNNNTGAPLAELPELNTELDKIQTRHGLMQADPANTNKDAEDAKEKLKRLYDYLMPAAQQDSTLLQGLNTALDNNNDPESAANALSALAEQDAKAKLTSSEDKRYKYKFELDQNPPSLTITAQDRTGFIDETKQLQECIRMLEYCKAQGLVPKITVSGNPQLAKRLATHLQFHCNQLELKSTMHVYNDKDPQKSDLGVDSDLLEKLDRDKNTRDMRQLHDTLQTAEKQVEKAVKGVDKAETALTKLQNRAAELPGKEQQLQIKMNALVRSHASRAEIGSLNTKINALRKEKRDIPNKIRDATAQLDHAKNHLAETTTRLCEALESPRYADLSSKTNCDKAAQTNLNTQHTKALTRLAAVETAAAQQLPQGATTAALQQRMAAITAPPPAPAARLGGNP